MSRRINKMNMQSLDYKVEGKFVKLKLENGIPSELRFDYPVRQVVIFESFFLVRIEPDFGKILNENVFCYSFEGEFLWKVEPTDTIDEDCPYMNIERDSGNLFFYNWSGERVKIDPIDGRVVTKTLIR